MGKGLANVAYDCMSVIGNQIMNIKGQCSKLTVGLLALLPIMARLMVFFPFSRTFFSKLWLARKLRPRFVISVLNWYGYSVYFISHTIPYIDTIGTIPYWLISYHVGAKPACSIVSVSNQYVVLYRHRINMQCYTDIDPECSIVPYHTNTPCNTWKCRGGGDFRKRESGRKQKRKETLRPIHDGPIISHLSATHVCACLFCVPSTSKKT